MFINISIRKVISLSSLILFLNSGFLSAQKKINKDSLIKSLTAEKNDTLKAKAYQKICRAFREGIPDSAIYYGNLGLDFIHKIKGLPENKYILLKLETNIYLSVGLSYEYKGDTKQSMDCFEKSLSLSTKNNYKKGIANAYEFITTGHIKTSNYTLALKYAEEGLKMQKEMNDKQGLFSIYNTMGVIYKHKGDYSKAIQNYYKSLGILEELKDSASIIGSINNIGHIYMEKRDFDKAIQCFDKSLKIAELIGESRSKAAVLLNLGNTYAAKNEFQKSLEYHFMSLKIAEDLKDPGALRDCYGNIGNVYNRLNNYAKAIEYHTKSMNISEEYADSAAIAVGYNTLGPDFIGLKNYPKAIEYHFKALNLGRKLNDIETIEYAYEGLVNSFSVTGNYKKAFEFKILFEEVQDSLLNSKNFDEMANLRANFEMEQTNKERDLIMHAKEIQQKADLDKQKMINIFLSIGGIIILLFAIVAVRAYLNKKKANKIIAAQKHEVEEQKEIIEEKNKDITDSINYAFRIQHAILKAEEHVSKHLPSHFILFKPKDIVSGDFYWTLEKHNHLYLAAADCTGHGVPGAFLTMLGVSFLNEINGVDELLTPAEILNRLRDRIIKELGQTGREMENKDGMDISLARINLKTNELQWAGANNPFYYTKDNELMEVKADKQPIAYYISMKPFTNHEFSFAKGDIFYLFTDGFADQFGGPEGKKFKYKQLQKKLIETQIFTVEDQKQKLNLLFEDWRGKLEQIDDVCIIGMRL